MQHQRAPGGQGLARVLVRDQALLSLQASRPEPVLWIGRDDDGPHTANLGNLRRGETVTLELRIAQPLTFEQGRLRLALPMTIADDKRKSDVWLTAMGESSLDFELVIWVGKDAIASPSRVEAAYKWQIHEELVAAGLEIPFPQRDLHLRSGALTVRLESGGENSVRVDPAP